MARLCSLGLSLLVLASGVGAVRAQDVRGRVVDEQTRRPVRQVEAVLATPDGAVVDRAVSNDSGFFRVAARRAGEFTLTVQRSGYTIETRVIEVQSGTDLVVPAFVLRSQAIQLDSVAAQADTRSRPEPAAVGFSRPTHLLAAARMAALETRGATMLSALREIPGLRVKDMLVQGHRVICVESTRRMMVMPGGPRSASSCQQVPFVMDGVLLDSSSTKPLLRNVNLQDYESIEYLPPVEAGQRYGLEASVNGVIVLWTRGRGPYVSNARNRR